MTAAGDLGLDFQLGEMADTIRETTGRFRRTWGSG